MRIFFVCFWLLLALLACSPFSNNHDQRALDCGEDFKGSDPVHIIDIDGSRLRGSDVEAFALGLDQKSDVPVSSKGCFNRPDHEVLIRHRDRPLGYVGQPSGTVVVLVPPPEPRLKATCIPNQSTRSELKLDDYLNLQAATQAKAYELHIKLATEAGEQLLHQTQMDLVHDSMRTLLLPENLPEGPAQLTISLNDLIRRESDPVTCPLIIDRTAPVPSLEVDVIREHVIGPRLLTEVDDRRLLQLNTNEGQLFYCLQKAEESPCEPTELYEKGINLSSWQGETIIRYRAIDAAGNPSSITSRNLLVVNPFQENEVANLAASSRAVAGKSFQTMFDALRAEEKRRQLPSAIQRERQSLASYWALLKNYMAPQAQLLNIPYSTEDSVGSNNDLSSDGEWLCFTGMFSDKAFLFDVKRQEAKDLGFSADKCRFSSDDSQIFFWTRDKESEGIFVDVLSLSKQKLPPLPIATHVRKIHLGPESQLYLVGPNHVFRWVLGQSSTWDVLYESQEDFAAIFSEKSVLITSSEGAEIFDLNPFQKRSTVALDRLDDAWIVNLSPDGKIVVGLLDMRQVLVWQWDVKKGNFGPAIQFNPHDERLIWNVVINSSNDQLILDHDNGTASVWSFLEGKFILRSREIGVRGDIVENITETRYPRTRFLRDGRIGIFSTHFLSIVQSQAAGNILASDIKQVVVNDDASKIVAKMKDDKYQLFQFDGEKLTVVSPMPALGYDFALSASGEVFAGKINGKINVWRIDESGIHAEQYSVPGLDGEQLALSEDGRSLAIAVNNWENPSVQVWHEGQLRQTRTEYCLPNDSSFSKIVGEMRFSPQGDRLLLSCAYGDGQIWDFKTDKLITIGKDLAITDSVFNESGNALLFTNYSVHNYQPYYMHSWKEDSGLKVFPFSANPIEKLAGSKDFKLIGTMSASELIFWNPTLDDKAIVWEGRNMFSYRNPDSNEDLVIASANLRTFVINEHNELIYWSLSAEDIYKNLCAMLQAQIHAMGLQGELCRP